MRNKKVKKIMSGFFASAMALTMILGTAAPAMAANPTGGTEADPAEACFSKNLLVPDGVTDPIAGSFSFTWTKAALDGDAAEAELLPDLAAVTLNPLADGTQADVEGGKKYSVSSANIVEGVTFPQPGIYTYSLKEAYSYHTGGNTLPQGDSISYSAAEYKVSVQTAWNEAGTATYVQNIVVEQVKDNAGSAPEGMVKVTPGTPGGDSAGNEFQFTNGYVRRSDTTTPDGESGALELKKAVTNAPAVLPDGVASSFTFSVDLTKSIGEVGNPSYAYETFDKTGASTGTGSIAFTGATASANFTLKDGEYVVVKDLPVGTKYEVKENGGAVLNNYNTSYTVTPETGAPVSVNGMTLGSQTFGTTGAQGVTCTNRYYSADTPTGILLDNLPFILLIAAAVFGAAAVFVTARKRRIQK